MGNQQVADLSNFKTIPFATDYLIDPEGNIYSTTSNKILKQVKRPDGYRRLKLRVNGLPKAYLVHRLVAEVFIPNPHGYKVVNHLDGVKSNNHVSNLEWTTQSGNLSHAFQTELRSNSGESNPRNILKDCDVLIIYQSLLSGMMVAELARLYQVDESTIQNIKTKRNWQSLLSDLPDINIRVKARVLTDEEYQYLISLRSSGHTARQISSIMGISIPQVESNIRKMRSESSTTIPQGSTPK